MQTTICSLFEASAASSVKTEKSLSFKLRGRLFGELEGPMFAEFCSVLLHLYKKPSFEAMFEILGCQWCEGGKAA